MFMHMKISSTSVQDASERIHDTNVALIDVRSPEEFASGRVPGAINIPLEDIPTKGNELSQYDTVYLICRSGGRSGRAVMFLSMDGIHAVNIEGGMLAWQNAGLAIEGKGAV